jgi:hypothetical protein
MKRSIESEEFSTIHWNEDYVISVFKIVAYYGFDTMDDIAMFCSIKKSFYDWAERYVFERCLTITTAIQERYADYNVFQVRRFFPRKSLLICKNRILLKTLRFINHIRKQCLYHASFTVIVNGEPVYNFYYGIDGLNYKTFTFNDYVVPGAKFDMNNQLVSKIRFTVELKK